MKYSDIRHPSYIAMGLAWRKWRLTYCGGDDFIDQYLEQFKREDNQDFISRKNITYTPAHAKAAVIEIKNSIFRRLGDVAREGGPRSYQAAIRGLLGGVDRQSSTMPSYIGRFVLPELLPMARVGIWVDRKPVPEDATLAENIQSPYLNLYKTEAIKSWTYAEGGRLDSILVEHCEYTLDPITCMPYGPETKTWRFMYLENGRVIVEEETVEGKITEKTLEIDRIPFVLFELDNSLLEDVCNIQIALLNMASADVNYATRGNFPFYTEQYDPKSNSNMARPAQQTSRTVDGVVIPAGQSKEAGEARRDEVTVGVSKGRRYAAGLNQPAFINPSPEPLQVSMQKEEQMKREIRALVHLSVATIDPTRSSAESKDADDKGLHNGLLAIASVLEQGEREIGEIWAAYERSEVPTIRYPLVWTMQSDEERRKDATELKKQLGTVPSKRFQKEVAKQIASKLVGHKVSAEVLDEIYAEIEEAQGITADSEELHQDVVDGLVTAKTASKFRGYAEGEAEKALEEQAKRLAIIAISQSQGAGAARGVPSGPTDPSANNEKKISQSSGGLPDPEKVRG